MHWKSDIVVEFKKHIFFSWSLLGASVQLLQSCRMLPGVSVMKEMANSVQVLPLKPFRLQGAVAKN